LTYIKKLKESVDGLFQNPANLTDTEQPIFKRLCRSYIPLTRIVYGKCTILYLHYEVKCMQTMLIPQSRLHTSRQKSLLSKN